MIPKNELRINNVVFDTEEKEIHHWDAVDFEDYFSNDGKYISIDPIPLTPEIFERCGFERNSNNEINRLEHNPIGVEIKQERFYLKLLIKDIRYIDEYELPIVTIREIEHLHQIQNLYFDLTGEELNIQTLISTETSPAAP